MRANTTECKPVCTPMSTTFSSTATTKVIWLQHLVQELGIPVTVPKIYSNNIGATNLCANLIFHTRMKHLEIDYRHVQELVATKQLYVSHVPTSHQLADLLMKPLSSSRHEFLKDKRI